MEAFVITYQHHHISIYCSLKTKLSNFFPAAVSSRRCPMLLLLVPLLLFSISISQSLLLFQRYSSSSSSSCSFSFIYCGTTVTTRTTTLIIQNNISRYSSSLQSKPSERPTNHVIRSFSIFCARFIHPSIHTPDINPKFQL